MEITNTHLSDSRILISFMSQSAENIMKITSNILLLYETYIRFYGEKIRGDTIPLAGFVGKKDYIKSDVVF